MPPVTGLRNSLGLDTTDMSLLTGHVGRGKLPAGPLNMSKNPPSPRLRWAGPLPPRLRRGRHWPTTRDFNTLMRKSLVRHYPYF
jgi:hypothetical protein